MRSLNVGRVLNRSERQLGESFAKVERSLGLHLEAGFL